MLLEENIFVAAILHVNGSSCLKFDHIIPDIHPFALVMDSKDDMLYYIFVTNNIGENTLFGKGNAHLVDDFEAVTALLLLDTYLIPPYRTSIVFQ